MRIASLVVCVLGVSIFSPVVGAQPAEESEESRRQAAEAHFRQGEAYYKEGLYDQAIDSYRESYRLSGLSELLINIGQSYRLKGDYLKALASYREFLRKNPEHQYADEVRRLVATLTKEVEEKHGKSAVPEETPSPTPSPTLAPAPAQPAPPQPQAAASHSTFTPIRIGGLATVAVGLAAAGLGLKYSLDANKIEDELASHDGPWTEDVLGKIDDGERAERNAIIFYSVGAGAVALGSLMYFLGGYSGEAPVAVAPVAGGGQRGVALSMQF